MTKVKDTNWLADWTGCMNGQATRIATGIFAEVTQIHTHTLATRIHPGIISITTLDHH